MYHRTESAVFGDSADLLSDFKAFTIPNNECIDDLDRLKVQRSRRWD